VRFGLTSTGDRAAVSRRRFGDSSGDSRRRNDPLVLRFRRRNGGQIATAKRFGFDHASAISDPAREAADCGAKVHDPDDAPPSIVEAEATGCSHVVGGS